MWDLVAHISTWQMPVILRSKVTSAVPGRRIVVMTCHGPQFVSPRDDIPTIGLGEIVWNIHFGQESVLDLRRKSDSLGPPVDKWLYLNLDVGCEIQFVSQHPRDTRRCPNSQFLWSIKILIASSFEILFRLHSLFNQSQST